ncbi:MAG: substrate-binding domain-containing protein [Tessaracoccus sp.]
MSSSSARCAPASCRASRCSRASPPRARAPTTSSCCGWPRGSNATLFFQGAMEVLQPKIDDGTLTVVSGQTEFTQVATQDWDNAKAQARMDSILAGNYSGDTQLHGVLSPNDGIARAILTSNEQGGRDLPVVTGLDAENESVKWIADGRQYSTVASPPTARRPHRQTIQALQSGEGLPEPDVTANNGGTKDVGIYQLDPIVVTQDNIRSLRRRPRASRLIEG